MTRRRLVQPTAAARAPGPGRTSPDNPYATVLVRGRVVEWLEGDAAWSIVDELSTKYTGGPYPRDDERVVALIEPEHATSISFG